MSYQPFGARHVVSHLSGLDFGLRVRVDVRPATQRAVLSVSENLTVQALTSELVEIVSDLQVYSYAVRGRLEQLTYALQSNVQFGAWSYARRAALDLAALLANAKKRGWLRGSLAVSGANCALRLADLSGPEVRCWPPFPALCFRRSLPALRWFPLRRVPVDALLTICETP